MPPWHSYNRKKKNIFKNYTSNCVHKKPSTKHKNQSLYASLCIGLLPHFTRVTVRDPDTTKESATAKFAYSTSLHKANLLPFAAPFSCKIFVNASYEWNRSKLFQFMQIINLRNKTYKWGIGTLTPSFKGGKIIYYSFYIQLYLIPIFLEKVEIESSFSGHHIMMLP